MLLNWTLRVIPSSDIEFVFNLIIVSQNIPEKKEISQKLMNKYQAELMEHDQFKTHFKNI